MGSRRRRHAHRQPRHRGDPAVRRRGGGTAAAGTTGEIDQVLRALDGGFIAAGPSGSPLRGLVNVLPTGRNFYSVDPKAVPSRLAWETGVAMADSLLNRYRGDFGRWPRSVGLSVWGTSAMRTAGDDIAEVLALLGVRPVWDDASRRVVEPRADLTRRTRPAAHRRHGAHLRLLPRRLPARGHHARRRGAAGRRASTSPPSDNYRPRPRAKPTSPSMVTNGAPPQGSSAPSRAPTARACCS